MKYFRNISLLINIKLNYDLPPTSRCIIHHTMDTYRRSQPKTANKSNVFARFYLARMTISNSNAKR